MAESQNNDYQLLQKNLYEQDIDNNEQNQNFIELFPPNQFLNEQNQTTLSQEQDQQKNENNITEPILQQLNQDLEQLNKSSINNSDNKPRFISQFLTNQFQTNLHLSHLSSNDLNTDQLQAKYSPSRDLKDLIYFHQQDDQKLHLSKLIHHFQQNQQIVPDSDDQILTDEFLYLLSQEENIIASYREIIEQEKAKAKNDIQLIIQQITNILEETNIGINAQLDEHYHKFVNQYKDFKQEVLDFKNVKIELSNYLKEQNDKNSRLDFNKISNANLIKELQEIQNKNQISKKIVQSVSVKQYEHFHKMNIISKKIIQQLSNVGQYYYQESFKKFLTEIKENFQNSFELKLKRMDSIVKEAIDVSFNAFQEQYDHNLIKDSQPLQQININNLNNPNMAGNQSAQDIAQFEHAQKYNFSQNNIPLSQQQYLTDQNYITFLNQQKYPLKEDLTNLIYTQGEKQQEDFRTKVQDKTFSGPEDLPKEIQQNNQNALYKGLQLRSIFSRPTELDPSQRLYKFDQADINLKNEKKIQFQQYSIPYELQNQQKQFLIGQNLPSKQFQISQEKRGVSIANSKSNNIDFLDLKFVSTIKTQQTDILLCLSICGYTNDKLAIASKDCSISIYFLFDSQKQLAKLQGHIGPICSLAAMNYSPKQQYLISGGDHKDNMIKVWCLVSFELVVTLKGHTAAIISIQTIHDNILQKSIISASYDREIICWNTSTSSIIQREQRHQSSITNLTITEDKKILVSVGMDNIIFIWLLQYNQMGKEAINNEQNQNYTLNSLSLDKTIKSIYQICSLQIKSDCKTLIAGCKNGNVIQYNILTGDLIKICQFKSDIQITISAILLFELLKPFPIQQQNYIIFGNPKEREFYVGDIDQGTMKKISSQNKFFIEFGVAIGPICQITENQQKELIGVFINQSKEEPQVSIWQINI